MELSTRQCIPCQSKLTPPHRSTITSKNRSIVVQMIGRMTTTIPPWQYTLRYLQLEIPCIQRTMMRIMRWNELQRIEVFVLRKINFSTIALRQGMRRRSTKTSQHQSTLIITRNTANKHRPKLPTTHSSTLELTVHKKKTTQLAVGQMIAITRAMQ